MSLVKAKLGVVTPRGVTKSCPVPLIFAKAALSEFLLKVKLPPVPALLPNNTDASEPDVAAVNLKKFDEPRFALPLRCKSLNLESENPKSIAPSLFVPEVVQTLIWSAPSLNLIAQSSVPINKSPPVVPILPTVEPLFLNCNKVPSLPILLTNKGAPPLLLNEDALLGFKLIPVAVEEPTIFAAVVPINKLPLISILADSLKLALFLKTIPCAGAAPPTYKVVPDCEILLS